MMYPEEEAGRAIVEQVASRGALLGPHHELGVWLTSAERDELVRWSRWWLDRPERPPAQEPPPDTQRLDWLEERVGDKLVPRCVEVSGAPIRSGHPTTEWRVHLNGVGYVGHGVRLREALDEAMEADRVPSGPTGETK